MSEFDRRCGYPEDWRMSIGLDAYAMADAMLAARSKSGEHNK